MFLKKALEELLQDVANTLSGGKKSFNTLLMIDGTIINDITQIP